MYGDVVMPVRYKPAMQKGRRDFNDLFLESLEESLKILIDESAKDRLFSHLEESCLLKEDEISQKPEVLSAELEKIFGVGASKIEGLIIALLYSKLGLKYEEKEEYKFGDYIRDARVHRITYVELPSVRRKLDEIDLKIIHSLRKDARKPITQVAKEIGVSRPTVISRLDKMMKKNILCVSAGLNIRELGFPTACVALEAKGVDLRQKVERNLSRCPRVLMLLRPVEKANMLVFLFGEDQNTLRSTIESLRDFSGADLVYVQHSEPPLFTESFSLRVFPEKSDTAPCGRKCVDCIHYQNDQCVGCPAVTEYKGPL